MYLVLRQKANDVGLFVIVGGVSKHPVEPVDPRLLKPVFDEACGFYQIGPVGANMDKFMLTISINSAANLIQVTNFLVS